MTDVACENSLSWDLNKARGKPGFVLAWLPTTPIPTLAQAAKMSKEKTTMSQPSAIARPAAGSPIAGWAEDPQGGLQLTGAEPPLTREEQDVQEIVHRFAAQVLKGTGLQAVPQEDGKAVVLYLCWGYRQTDIGPYNEVAVTVLSVAPQDPAPAIYVADLPVTTEAANRAGQELWGYNKFVTNIEIKGDGKQFSTIVHDPHGGLISSLEGTRGVSVPVAPTDIYSFSLLEKKIIKTFV